MTRLSNLTLRNLLIAAHDALATTLAVLASFYLRFEGEAFFDRLPLLLRILPYFIAFSVVVCYVFNLTTTKWRFISLPDALNILRVGDRADASRYWCWIIFLSRPTFMAGWRRRIFKRRSSSARSPSSSTGFSRCSS